jgi:hypothetical protein
MKFPRGAEREYLQILGIAAIYVAELPSGCVVGVSRDLDRTLGHLQRISRGAEIGFAVWVRNKLAAERIRRNVGHHDEDIRQLAMRVKIEADMLDIPITDHDVVMARVATVVELVERKIEEANRSGDLAWFNTAFRKWRLRARPLGRGMAYGEARARLRRAVFQNGAHRVSSELLPDVFPKL